MALPNKLNPLTLEQIIQFAEPEAALDTLKITKTLKFGNVTWLQKKSGKYTPADDIFPLLSADLASNETANLTLLLVEGGSHTNFVSFNRNDDWGCYDPIKNVMLKISPNGSGIERPKQFFFDGRLAAPNPMTQGVPVTYCLVIAQAVLL